MFGSIQVQASVHMSRLICFLTAAGVKNSKDDGVSNGF